MFAGLFCGFLGLVSAERSLSLAAKRRLLFLLLPPPPDGLGASHDGFEGESWVEQEEEERKDEDEEEEEEEGLFKVEDELSHHLRMADVAAGA